jgi:hypothetical protein
MGNLIQLPDSSLWIKAFDVVNGHWMAFATEVGNGSENFGVQIQIPYKIQHFLNI